MARDGGRERILDIVPLLKNGDRLVIYTATNARSALKISRSRGTCSRRFSVFFTFRFLFAFSSGSLPLSLSLSKPIVSLFLRSFNLSRSSQPASSVTPSFFPFPQFLSIFLSFRTCSPLRIPPRSPFHVPRTRCDIRFRPFIPAGYRVMTVSRLPEVDFSNAPTPDRPPLSFVN